jgi:hypothetical protein
MTCVAILFPATGHAMTYSARLRFLPSQDPTVVGYHVYVGPVGATADPQDVGLPVTDPDGFVTVIVPGLEVRETYALAASSYTADGTESRLSNQVRLGYEDVAPFVDSDHDGLSDAVEDLNLNMVLNLGETDPFLTDTDGDGVRDRRDRCQRTRPGTHVDAAGCPRCQRARDCYDGDPCTRDICNGDVCRFVAAADATPCSDGLFCNGLETCRAGVCTDGVPPDCDDTSSCTEDACDEELGRCIHEGLADCCASDADCAGTDTCSTNPRCVGGTCSSDARPCDGGTTCRPATCDPIDGCRTDGTPDAMPCDAGDPCSSEAVCYRNTCRVTGQHRLQVPRLALRAQDTEHRLVARVTGTQGTALDPGTAGVHLELLDPAGAPLHDVTIPPQRFRATRGGRVHSLLLDDAAGGVEQLVITQKRTRIRIVISARLPQLTASPGTLVIRSGNACLSAIALECTQRSGGAIRCR